MAIKSKVNLSYMEGKMFCKTCKTRKNCKKICPELEKYLRKFTTPYDRNLTGRYYDRGEDATYEWAGGQDKDFIDANMGWD